MSDIRDKFSPETHQTRCGKPWRWLDVDADDDGALAIAVKDTNDKWSIIVWIVDRDGRAEWQTCIEGVYARDYDLIPVANEIDWDGFDWDFFNRYGGIGVIFPDGPDMLLENIKSPKDVNSADIMLRESPFYYWAGGEQPVPDKVEVELIYRDVDKESDKWPAGERQWGLYDSNRDIIAFKLTGIVL